MALINPNNITIGGGLNSQGLLANNPYKNAPTGLTQNTTGTIPQPNFQQKMAQMAYSTPGVRAVSPTDNQTSGLVTLPKNQVSTTNAGTGQSSTSGGTNATNPNQGLINQDQSKLTDLQNQQIALSTYGLNNTNQLTKDASGNYIPATPTGTNGVNYGANNIPTAGSIAAQTGNILNNPSPAITQAQQQVMDVNNTYQNQLNGLAGTKSFGNEGSSFANQAQANYQQQMANASQNLLYAQQQQEQGLQGLQIAGGLVSPIQETPGTSNYLPGTNTLTPNLAGTQGGSGGLQGVGAIQGQIQNGATQTQLNAYLGQAQTTGADLQNIISSGGINPTALPAANQLVQWFNSGVVSGTGNEKYQEFAGEMNDFINKMAPILTGGSTTNMANEMASAMVNAAASGQSISDVINHYLALAKSNVQAIGTGGGAGVGSSSGSNTVFSPSSFYGGQ